MEPVEVMNKVLSNSDATNGRLEFPYVSLGGFPDILDDNRSVNFDASDMLGGSWSLKLSIRQEGPYRKPWIHGEWGRYAREKRLRRGDRVKLARVVQDNGGWGYEIIAERNLAMGVWIPIEEWHARNGDY